MKGEDHKLLYFAIKKDDEVIISTGKNRTTRRQLRDDYLSILSPTLQDRYRSKRLDSILHNFGCKLLESETPFE